MSCMFSEATRCSAPRSALTRSWAGHTAFLSIIHITTTTPNNSTSTSTTISTTLAIILSLIPITASVTDTVFTLSVTSTIIRIIVIIIIIIITCMILTIITIFSLIVSCYCYCSQARFRAEGAHCSLRLGAGMLSGVVGEIRALSWQNRCQQLATV